VSAAVRSYLTGKTEVIACFPSPWQPLRRSSDILYPDRVALSLLGVAIGVVLGPWPAGFLRPNFPRAAIPAGLASTRPLAEGRRITRLLRRFAFTLCQARSEKHRAATLFRDAWDGAHAVRSASWRHFLLTVAGWSGWGVSNAAVADALDLGGIAGARDLTRCMWCVSFCATRCRS